MTMSEYAETRNQDHTLIRENATPLFDQSTLPGFRHISLKGWLKIL